MFQAGIIISSLFLPTLAQAKYLDVERFLPTLTPLATREEPAAFLYQPSTPLAVPSEQKPLLVIGASGLVVSLVPNPEAFSSERQDVVAYIVSEGDTPSSIAAQFGITLSTLLWANKLSERSIIRPGQELLILPVSGVKHDVKRGDTIQSIANRYQASAEDIIGFNDLPASGEIFVGDTIIIPGGKLPFRPPFSRSYPRVTLPRLDSGFFLMPTVGRNQGRLHGFNAVDIASVCGTAVVASAAGVVSIADGSGWNGGYGKYIRIRHANGVQTTYAHLRLVAVWAGQTLDQGDYIGEVGTTGRSTGCHVHFEVRGARNPFAR